jgi:hypothetical protein
MVQTVLVCFYKGQMTTMTTGVVTATLIRSKTLCSLTEREEGEPLQPVSADRRGGGNDNKKLWASIIYLLYDIPALQGELRERGGGELSLYQLRGGGPGPN